MTDQTPKPQQPEPAQTADDCRVLSFGPHNLLQCGPANTLRTDQPGALFLLADDFALVGDTAEAIDEMRRQWPVVVDVPPHLPED
jgi:hypothetical protein